MSVATQFSLGREPFLSLSENDNSSHLPTMPSLPLGGSFAEPSPEGSSGSGESSSSESLRSTDGKVVSLWQAIAHADFKILAEYLKDIKTFCDYDNNKRFPLIWATENGFSKSVEFILSYILSVETDKKTKNEDAVLKVILMVSDKKMNAVMVAVTLGNINLLKLFLQYEKNEELVSAVDAEGRNIFHIAALNGQLSILQYLYLFHNKDQRLINSKARDGSTALHLAAKGGFPEVVNFLLNKHPTLIHEVLKDGSTALVSAAANNKENSIVTKNSIIKLMIQKSPTLLLEDLPISPVDKLLLKKQHNVECLVLLLEGLEHNLLSDVKKRLDEIRAREMVQAKSQSVLRDLTATLSQKMANALALKQKIVDEKQITGILISGNVFSRFLAQSPLSVELAELRKALISGDDKTVNELLTKKPGLVFEPLENRTSLMIAAELGNAEFVDLLLSYDKEGRLLYAKTVEGYTAAMFAAKAGSLTCLKLLLKYDTEQSLLFDYENHLGMNAVQIATFNNHHAVVGFVIQEMDTFYNLLYSSDFLGNTLAHMALTSGAYDLAFQLMRNYKGAFPEISEDSASKLLLALFCERRDDNSILCGEMIKLLASDPSQCFGPKIYGKILKHWQQLKDIQGKENSEKDALFSENFSEFFRFVAQFVRAPSEDSCRRRMLEIEGHQIRINLSIKTIQEMIQNKDKEILKLQAILAKKSNTSDGKLEQEHRQLFFSQSEASFGFSTNGFLAQTKIRAFVGAGAGAGSTRAGSRFAGAAGSGSGSQTVSDSGKHASTNGSSGKTFSLNGLNGKRSREDAGLPYGYNKRPEPNAADLVEETVSEDAREVIRKT